MTPKSRLCLIWVQSCGFSFCGLCHSYLTPEVFLTQSCGGYFCIFFWSYCVGLLFVSMNGHGAKCILFIAAQLSQQYALLNKPAFSILLTCQPHKDWLCVCGLVSGVCSPLAAFSGHKSICISSKFAATNKSNCETIPPLGRGRGERNFLILKPLNFHKFVACFVRFYRMAFWAYGWNFPTLRLRTVGILEIL